MPAGEYGARFVEDVVDHLSGWLDGVHETGALACRQYAVVHIAIDPPQYGARLAHFTELVGEWLYIFFVCCPIITETVTNYAGGLAGVPARDYRSANCRIDNLLLVVDVPTCLVGRYKPRTHPHPLCAERQRRDKAATGLSAVL